MRTLRTYTNAYKTSRKKGNRMISGISLKIALVRMTRETYSNRAYEGKL
jgi:hypothetical protein